MFGFMILKRSEYADLNKELYDLKREIELSEHWFISSKKDIDTILDDHKKQVRGLNDIIKRNGSQIAQLKDSLSKEQMKNINRKRED